ncbi:MAG: hypothetical protein H0T89_36055 [Deltaproteobacteria bacterium]|nr:hypothetical protein [Deltaproteobacteria bacterium]
MKAHALAVGIWLIVCGAPHVAAAPQATGLPPGDYRVVEVQIAAMPTTRRGRPWDEAPGEAPDLVVKIQINGAKAVTCYPAENAVIGKCRLDLPFVLDETSHIELDIVDRDTVLDDPIGTARLGDPARWSTGVAMPLVVSGRLENATITLARAPTWWDLHRTRLLGLGGGIVLALGVLGGFRRSLMPPPPTPRAPARCSHCQVLLGDDLRKCSHCGAAQTGASS